MSDHKYGDKQFNKQIKQDIGLSRIFLHAYKLNFYWGKDNNQVEIIADLDNDLKHTLEYFGYN